MLFKAFSLNKKKDSVCVTVLDYHEAEKFHG